VKINNALTFSSSLRRSTLAEVPGGGGGLLIQPQVLLKKGESFKKGSPYYHRNSRKNIFFSFALMKN
jgi:hypothetical protein